MKILMNAEHVGVYKLISEIKKEIKSTTSDIFDKDKERQQKQSAIKEKKSFSCRYLRETLS
jgi:hypothetical protein